MPYDPPPELRSLSIEAIAKLVAARKLPPVESWQPERVGDSEMHIAKNGTWYHQETLIKRPAMVRLFSSVLRHDTDGYWLVTPFEKLKISVEDAPFVAVDMQISGADKEQVLSFRLNTDDLVIADNSHPIRMTGTAESPWPYLTVRHRLEATLSRSVYFSLLSLVDSNAHGQLGFWTSGQYISLPDAVS